MFLVCLKKQYKSCMFLLYICWIKKKKKSAASEITGKHSGTLFSKKRCLLASGKVQLPENHRLHYQNRGKNVGGKNTHGQMLLFFPQNCYLQVAYNRSYVRDSIIILKYQWIVLQQQPTFCIYLSISENRICATYTEHMYWKFIKPIKAFLSATP